MKYFFYSIFFALLFSGYTSVFAQHAGETDGYHLVWQDLFDESTINTAVWNVDNATKSPELEQYLPANVSVGIEPESGEHCLIITAKKENYGNQVCTSGKVKTQGKMSFQHGKIEARIKLPKTGNGLWPAFWMMGDDFAQVGWPKCGEIDILEMGSSSGIKSGTQDRYFNGALHWGQSGDQGNGQSKTWSYSLQDTFHLYTLIWDANAINMYVDLDAYPNSAPYATWSIPASTSTSAVGYYFHKPFYVIINLAIGGDFTGITGNNNIDKITAFQEALDGEPKMYVNYVKIYQLGTSDEVYNGPLLTSMRVPVSESLKISQDLTGNIQVNAAEIPKSIALFSITGQKISEVYKTNSVYASSLPAGCYIANIKTNTGESKSCKFIKK